MGSHTTPESDQFRGSAGDNTKILERFYHLAVETGSTREGILPNLLGFKKLREEGLGMMAGPYLRSTFILYELYTQLGMVEEEMKSLVRDLTTWRMMGVGLLGAYLTWVMKLRRW